MRAQPPGQPVGGLRIDVVQADRANAGTGQRGGDGRADTAGADHQHPRASELATLAQHAAHEAFAIEHVADEPAVGRAAHRVAGAGDLHRRRHLVEQAHRGDLVRHGDQGAGDVAEREHRSEKYREVLRLATHGYDHRIHAGLFEPGVVDHRRLEAVRGKADVGDEGSVAGDHVVADVGKLGPGRRTGPYGENGPGRAQHRPGLPCYLRSLARQACASWGWMTVVKTARGAIFDLRRESLELRKLVNMLHPVEPFGRLYLHGRR